MSQNGNDLASWLLQQIDADEVTALAATPNSWRVDDGAWFNEPGVSSLLIYPDHGMGAPAFAIKDRSDADHIARWDPAHVLGECNAKRRLIGLISQVDRLNTNGGTSKLLHTDLQRTMLRTLALPYAGRPGYLEEWRP